MKMFNGETSDEGRLRVGKAMKYVRNEVMLPVPGHMALAYNQKVTQ